MSATLDSAVEAEAANSTGPVAMEAWLTYAQRKELGGVGAWDDCPDCTAQSGFNRWRKWSMLGQSR